MWLQAPPKTMPSCHTLNLLGEKTEIPDDCALTITSVPIVAFDSSVINPRRMREGYGSRFVCVSVYLCVCVCVCYHTSCYIPRLYVENKVPLDFLWRFQYMNWVDFIEIALFKSSGDIR